MTVWREWRVWRHPPPVGAAGRCIGQTNLPVDARKAKRLAHRIRRTVQREGGLREVWTSPLQRCADVGRWLRRWGWRHRVDPRLSEVSFGAWDGRPWAEIDVSQVDAWCADFARHAPGGGESVLVLMARCRAFMADFGERGACIVAHAGWVNALRWVLSDKQPPFLAADWPAAIAYGERLAVIKPAGATAGAPNRNSG